jgi:hypothetical protein
LKLLLHLINTRSKKTTLWLVAIFGLLSFGDYEVLTMRIPDFDQGKVSEGLLYEHFKGIPTGRTGPSLMLKVDKKIMKFSCNFTTQLNKGCISKIDRHAYANKPAKVWFYQEKILGWKRVNKLLQLEVSGKLILSYEQQKNRYLGEKNRHVYLMFTFFLIAFFVFLILQLDDDPHRNISGK